MLQQGQDPNMQNVHLEFRIAYSLYFSHAVYFTAWATTFIPGRIINGWQNKRPAQIEFTFL